MSPAHNLPEAQKAPVNASPTSSTPLPTDTVTLSSGAGKAPAGGDVDHDGDSH
jgi:hypothetical protein